MKYERLTKYNEYSHNAEVYAYTVGNDNVYFDGIDIVGNENSTLAQETIDKLAELEDKIENGTLIELPCKVGKILYEVCEKPNDNLFVKLPSEFFIVEHRVCDIKIRMIGKKPIFAIFTSNKEFGVMTWAGEHIGSQLFLTKAEAEKKLRELQGK